jgi:hypothetical protein
MASVYSITTEGEEALAAATAETLLQLNGVATCKAKVVQWSVSFDGVSATAEPVQVKLLRQTSTGASGSAASEIKWDPDNPTALLIGLHSFGTNPTAGDVLEHYEVHPQAGIVIQYPLGREPTIDNATSSKLGIEVTSPAVVNAVATLVWEE